MSASYHMLGTLAGPAAAAIARMAMDPRSGSRRLGAIINPTNAVNTASAITRGFINAMKWGTRAAKPEREGSCRRVKGIVVVFISILSGKVACEIGRAHV